MKHSEFTFLQTMDSLRFMVIHIFMCHITFSVHVYELTFMLVNGGDGGAITAERAGRQVMLEVTSTSACVVLVDIFKC